MDLEREVAELKRRVDLHDTLLAQQSGQFEFISTQMREMQRFMHAKFGQVDERLDGIDHRLDGIDQRLDRMEARLDALPRAIAEMLANR